jgi:hypothetical protein
VRLGNAMRSAPDQGEVGLVTTYSPETIDTSHMTLTADLEELIERLAQNNHDHWARKALPRAGVTPQRGTIKKSSILISCLTISSQNRRSNTTVQRSWKHSRPSRRCDMK